jgi:hypothetical protein
VPRKSRHYFGLLLLDNGYRENQVARANIVYYIQSLNNLTKACVNAVEVLGVAAVVADEEL